MTVNKLLAFLLAIALLIVIVLSWNSVMVPLIDRTGGMLDEVLLFFSGGRGGSGIGECFDEEVSVPGVGKGELKVCGGYCEIRLEEEFFSGYPFDFSSEHFRYDMRTGIMNSRDIKRERWSNINNDKFLGIDVEMAGRYRDIYADMKDELRDSFFGGDEGKFESFMKFNSKDVLELRVEMSGYDRIYRRRGVGTYRWDWHTTEGASTRAQGGGTLTDEGLINDVWKYYEDGRNVYWGYKEEGASEKFPTGLYMESIARDSRFPEFINDKKEEWDEKMRAYEDLMVEMERVGINIGGSEYVLVFSGHCVGSTDHCTPLVLIDFPDDRVGVYYELGKIKLYSREKGEEYKIMSSLGDEEWGEIVRVNKFYGFFKDACK
jgi:hypothetical protein